MTFVQLEVFAVLAELKSFTLSAQHLRVSQSAISHAIKALEKHWNVQLFYRNNNEVELTPQGYELTFYANEILNISKALNEKVSDFNELRSGKIRIGSFGASSSNVLIPLILEKFMTNYPNVEVFIEEGTDKQIAQWITERKIDIGFVVLPEERFDTYPVIEDIFVALVPKNLPISKQKSVALRDLTQYPFLMTAAGSEKHVNDIFLKSGLTPKIKSHFSQILTIINMVNNNMGVSIVADMALDKNLLQSYSNVSKQPLLPNIKRSIGLAVKNKAQISPIVQAFITLAQSI